VKYQQQALEMPDFPAEKRAAARDRVVLYQQGKPHRE
jgi:hypothetical protein